MQHKGFFRHTPSGMVLKKKGDEQLTALQTTFRRENLSLAGCSSAEPASVSVQQYKIQISKLYLQPVEIPSHFQKSKYSGLDVQHLKKLKELESELSQYKKIVAEQTWQIHVLKDVIEKKL